MMINKKSRCGRDDIKGIIYLAEIFTVNGISFGGKHLRSLHTMKLTVPLTTVATADFNFIFCTKSTLLL